MLTYANTADAYAHFVEAFGDGLPVVLPTAARVDELLASSGRDPGEIVGAIFPRGTLATVRDVAVNAVMAGCRLLLLQSRSAQSKRPPIPPSTSMASNRRPITPRRSSSSAGRLRKPLE